MWSRLLAMMLMVGLPAWGFPQDMPVSSDSTAMWIERLGDPDPEVRLRAEEQLKAQGTQVREQLLQASRSVHPEIAARASALLMALPWSTPQDPPEVQALLREYGSGDVAMRIAIVNQLAELPRARSAETLVRLVQEDPSPQVAWTIVALLRQNPDPHTQKLIRQIDTSRASPPVLVLVGRAEFNTHHARALELLQRAVDGAILVGENDQGELDVAINILALRARQLGHYDQALRLRRLSAARAALMPSGHPMGAALEVLAIHADHGPSGDFPSDLARFNRHRNQSEYRYAMGRIFANHHMSLASAACYLAAHSASRHPPETRLRIGDRLSAVGWDDLAEMEYRAVLQAPRQNPPLHQINAHLRLAGLAGARRDHARAAEHLQSVLDLAGEIPEGLVRNRPGGRVEAFDAEELRHRILLHRFHQARALGQDTQAHVQSLLESNPNDTDVVLELVEHLLNQNRRDQATDLLQRAYDRVRQQLQAYPDDPSLLNELAWLKARSGLHVQEGYELALKAVALEPDNPAFLDTLAEAAFRLGKVHQAIELEERALELRPGDAFMLEQLARFRAGLNAIPDEHP